MRKNTYVSDCSFFLDTAEIYPHNVAYVLFNTTAVSIVFELRLAQ